MRFRGKLVADSVKKGSILLALAMSCALAWGAARQDTGLEVPDLVGTLPGSFSANDSGAATYAIALQVPRAIGQAGPSLSLVYDSQQANGVVGVGFALSGIPRIARCRAHLALDGYNGTVDFTANDRFCLDNQRLIEIQGGAYGSENSLYHTEKETWTRFAAVGACGTGPCSFTATTKSGLTLQFSGNLTVPNAAEKIQWDLTSVTDLNGNVETIRYDVDNINHQSLPAAIDYTQNTAANVASAMRVSFSYETRPDVVPYYRTGVLFKTVNRLAQITTSTSGSTVLSYKIDYTLSAANHRSLIQQVSQCDAGGKCLPATRVSWTQTINNVENAGGNANGTIATGTCAGTNFHYRWADFDGDGLPDLLCDGDDGKHFMAISNGTSLKPATSIFSGAWCPGLNAGNSQWIDFNGDQQADAACPNANGAQQVLLSTGTTLKPPNGGIDGTVKTNWCPITGSTASCAASFGNFSDDGRADLLCDCGVGTANDSHKVMISQGTSVTSVNSFPDGTVKTNWCTSPNSYTFWGDFNGDGMVDLFCVAPSGKIDVQVASGGMVKSPNSSPTGTITDSWCAAAGDQLGTVDFNNDGNLDLYCSNNSSGTLKVLLSTGKLLISPNGRSDGTLLTNWCVGPKAMLSWGDFNGDGLPDLLCSNGGVQSMKLATVSSNGTMSMVSVDNSANGTLLSGWCAAGQTGLVDLNGDGLQDLACDQTDGTHLGKIHVPNYPDLASMIVDGVKGSVTISYKPLTDDTVYSRGGKASSYPALNVQTPLYVVSAYTLSNGLDGGNGWSQKFSKTYAGWLLNLDYGLSMGFASVTTTEAATGRVIKKTFDQTFPAQGFPTETTTLDKAGRTLSKVISVPLATTPYPKVNQVLTANVTRQVYSSGALAYATRTNYEYDIYGNVTLVSDLGDPGQIDQAVYSCTKYENDDARWRLGYPIEGKVTRSEAACTNFLSNPETTWVASTDLSWSQATYDTRMNRRTNSSWNDAGSNWITVTTDYNLLGLPSEVIDSAGNATKISYTTMSPLVTTTVTSPATANAGPLSLISVTDSRFGMTVSQTDANGSELKTVLDSFGRAVQQWGPDASGTSSSPIQLTATRFGSDGYGTYTQVSTRPDWIDGTIANWPWQRQYADGLDRFVRAEAGGNDVRTTVTQTLYDGAGLPWKTSLPTYDGDTVAWTATTYDSYNRPLTTTLPDGTVNSWNYVDGGSAATTVTATMAAGTTDARPQITYLNARGSVIKSILAAQPAATTDYDPLQRPIHMVGPNGNETQVTYDSLGKPTGLVNSDVGASTYAYDASGRLSSTTDGAGNKSEFDYDTLNRVTKRTSTRSGAETITTVYDYDQKDFANGKGNLTTLTRPSSVERFGYSAYGLVASENLVVAGSTYDFKNVYDPIGRIVDATFPDQAVARTGYDALGNVTSVSLKDAGASDFVSYALYSGYDAVGRPKTAAYGNGLTSSYIYNPDTQQGGLPKSWIVAAAGSEAGAAPMLTTTFGWNAVGQIAQVQRQHKSEAVRTTTYAYRSTGWIGTATGATGTSGYDYDGSGNLSAKDGVTYSFQPKTNKVVAGSDGLSVAYGGNGVFSGRALSSTASCYLYSAEANLQSVYKTTAWPGGAIQCGDLSAFSKVLDATYDDNGQRLIRTDADGTTSLYISSDFEERRSGAQIFQTKYLEGPDGRIAQITRDISAAPKAGARSPSQAPPTHGHLDGVGSVAGRMAGLAAALFAGALTIFRRRSAFTRFAVDHPIFARIVPVVILSLVLSGTPLPIRGELGKGNGYPVVGELFFHHDQIGSAVLVTDSSGAEVTRLGYLPFGTIDAGDTSGPNIFRQKFTAKETDEASDLVYFGARYYSPELGRFIQPDPSWQFDSPYLYAANDPQTRIDPDGRFVQLVVLAVVVIVGAYFGGQAVNHSYNPAAWNWTKGKTYAGVFTGAALGAAGGALGVVAVDAGATAGIVGNIAIGTGEGAAFGALAGDSQRQLGIDAAFGAATAGIAEGAFAGADAGLAAAGSRLSRRAAVQEGDELASGEAASADSCNSFVAGTPVWLDHGLQPIESVKAGDWVWGWIHPGQGDGQPARFPVREVLAHQASRLVTLTVAGETIRVTPDHNFWAAEQGWVAAKDIEPGMALLARDGSRPEVSSVSETDVPSTAVWNFSVDTAHTYAVSPLGLVAHNPTCPLSQVPPPRSYVQTNNQAKITEFNDRVQAAIAKFGDLQVTYEDPPAGVRGLRKIDFHGYTEHTVNLQPPIAGDRPAHFNTADATVGGGFQRDADNFRTAQNVPAGGTWHHSSFTYGQLQYIPTDVHTAVRHQGWASWHGGVPPW